MTALVIFCIVLNTAIAIWFIRDSRNAWDHFNYEQGVSDAWQDMAYQALDQRDDALKTLSKYVRPRGKNGRFKR